MCHLRADELTEGDPMTAPPFVYESYKVWHEGRYLKLYKAMSGAIEESLNISRSTAGVGVEQGALSVLSSWVPPPSSEHFSQGSIS
jgi:hypothetical protein